MAESFQAAVDVGNRALQLLGAQRMTALTDDSKNASEVAFVYEGLRRGELRRNIWTFSVRKASLRPVGTQTMRIVPVVYDAAKSYVLGSLVSLGTLWYIAMGDVAVGVAPVDHGTAWVRYFGSVTVEPWDSTQAYYSGELVYTPNTSAAVVYLSLQASNEDVPTTIPAWDATVTYKDGDTVSYLSVTYQCTMPINLNQLPNTLTGWQTIPATQPDQMQGQKWLKLTGATLTNIVMIYPLGSGPRDQSNTRNVYILPHGFLRLAPQDPKAGSWSFLGAPSGLGYEDWTFENGMIVSREVYPIVLRFAADVADVSLMDDLFCEGLACRIALATCETITQSGDKLASIGQQYSKFMGEARIVNGIEQGPTEPPEDDFITCQR